MAILSGLLQPIVGTLDPLLAKYLAYINGTLAPYNLSPDFPLDGGRVFQVIIWGSTHRLRRSTLVAANLERFIVVQTLTADFPIGLQAYQPIADSQVWSTTI